MKIIRTSVILSSIAVALGFSPFAFPADTHPQESGTVQSRRAILEISADGTLSYAGKKTDMARVSDRELEQLIGSQAGTNAITIAADETVPFGTVNKVYNAAKSAGFSNIDFGTISGQQPSNESTRQAVATKADATGMASDATVGPNLYNDKHYLSRFSPFEPSYFALELGPESKSKFQFSFKFKPFGKEVPDDKVKDEPFYTDLYLAYSQTSLWDLTETSKPFYDTSYRPTVFYFKDNLWQDLGWVDALGVRTGFEHESNGKGGSDSRSLNIYYVQPTFYWEWDKSFYINLAPKFFAYIDKNENPSIDEYRGYVNLLAECGIIDSWKVSFSGYAGNSFDHGSLEVNVSYPLENIVPFVNTYLQFQYFNGYGESLLDYDKKRDSQFRIGLMLFR